MAFAVAGPAWLCGSALAQDSAARIEQRIDAVFKIVPRNSVDLAVPLTRRALAQRSASLPLPYQPVEPQVPLQPDVPRELQVEAPPEAPAETVASQSGERLAGPAEVEMEEGSAEGDAEDDLDAARLPRPRPGDEAPVELARAAEDAGDPIELVAGAPLPGSAKPTSAPRWKRGQTSSGSEQESEAVLTPARLPSSSPADEPRKAWPEQPAVELVARADCLTADKVNDKDGDFGRNAEGLTAPGFCISVEKFKERRRPWTVQTVESGRPGPLWAVMHDDEDVAFDSAVEGLKEFGGVLVTLDTGGKRNQDGIDPNRNFSDEEISCSNLGKAAAPRFTELFKKWINPAQPIIALHNNFNGRVPTRGIGHLSMDAIPKKMRVARSSDPEGPMASDRALLLLAAAEPVSPDVENRMDALSAFGINVVLETVKAGSGDCSLSNYAVLSGHKAYFNVTVNHDEGNKQRRIVEAILSTSATVATSD